MSTATESRLASFLKLDGANYLPAVEFDALSPAEQRQVQEFYASKSRKLVQLLSHGREIIRDVPLEPSPIELYRNSPGFISIAIDHPEIAHSEEVQLIVFNSNSSRDAEQVAREWLTSLVKLVNEQGIPA